MRPEPANPLTENQPDVGLDSSIGGALPELWTDQPALGISGFWQPQRIGLACVQQLVHDLAEQRQRHFRAAQVVWRRPAPIRQRSTLEPHELQLMSLPSPGEGQ